ncbi:MAG: class I SAM-dependent methyltransferase, partial [Terriglobales bacterium]
VYNHLERHTANGRILDIGCGSGNTATEMDGNYRTYVGVDISETALAKARKRSEDCGRQDKNVFECSDFLSYTPTGQFDVILFRESMYHVPIGKVKSTLDRYAAYLNDGGVFIVRLFATSRQSVDSKAKHRPAAMLKIMETEFDVLEKRQYDTPGRPTVIVFRPKAQHP